MTNNDSSEFRLRRAKVVRAALHKYFRHLVGKHFTDRTAELGVLRDFFEPFSGRSGDPSPTVPPLVISGPGGIGESTLVARFLLENDELEDSHFSFIDFERPGFAEEPLELIREAALQLSLPNPLAVRGVLLGAQMPLIEREEFRHEEVLVHDFCSSVNVVAAKMPILIVLDSIETVQIRGARAMQRLRSLLDRLQQNAPALRIILISRLPINEFRTQNLQLGEFGRGEAVQLMKRFGFDESTSVRLVQQIGGNPLTLTLAANIPRPENGDPNGLNMLEISEVLKTPDMTSVQSALLSRVLAHIENPEIRKLASAGLIVRRITPEVILAVLAEPCGLSVLTLQSAQSLFRLLEREVWVTSIALDGSLQFRVELRRMLLGHVGRNQPEMVQSIHENAIRYYETKSDCGSRAEELYHRLVLEQTASELDARWIAGIGPLLASSLDEFPSSSREYLRVQLEQKTDRLSQQFEE